MSDNSIFTFSLKALYETFSVSILDVSVKGNSIKKVVPLLSSDLTDILPLCNNTNDFTIDRPIPLPSFLLEKLVSS